MEEPCETENSLVCFLYGKRWTILKMTECVVSSPAPNLVLIKEA